MYSYRELVYTLNYKIHIQLCALLAKHLFMRMELHNSQQQVVHLCKCPVHFCLEDNGIIRGDGIRKVIK